MSVGVLTRIEVQMFWSVSGHLCVSGQGKEKRHILKLSAYLLNCTYDCDLCVFAYTFALRLPL